MKKWIKSEWRDGGRLIIDYNSYWHFVYPLEVYLQAGDESEGYYIFKIPQVSTLGSPDYMPEHFRIQKKIGPDITFLSDHGNAFTEFNGDYERMIAVGGYARYRKKNLDNDIIIDIKFSTFAHKKRPFVYVSTPPLDPSDIDFYRSNVLDIYGKIDTIDGGIEGSFTDADDFFNKEYSHDPIEVNYKWKDGETYLRPLTAFNNLNNDIATYTPIAYPWSDSATLLGEYTGTAGTFVVGYLAFTVSGDLSTDEYVLDIDITYDSDLLKWFFVYSDGNTYYSSTKPTTGGGSFSDEDPTSPTVLTLIFLEYQSANTDEYLLPNEVSVK